MTYKNEAHQRIYRSFVAFSPFKYSRRFLAAAYLLSAEKELWFRARKAMNGKQLQFDKIDRTGLSEYAYILLRAARDLYEDTHHISLADLGDPYLFSDKTCLLFVEAIGVCREGYGYIGISRKFN